MTGSTHKKNNSLQPNLFDKGNTVSRKKDEAERAVIYCDGASRGNPGKAGIGVVISLVDKRGRQAAGQEVFTISEYIGITTNNVAEYSALITGIGKARSMGVGKIKIFLDSELLVKQINGVYKVKNRNLIPLWTKAMNILKDFDNYTITHVPREMNREADKLAREAVKKHGLRK